MSALAAIQFAPRGDRVPCTLLSSSCHPSNFRTHRAILATGSTKTDGVATEHYSLNQLGFEISSVAANFLFERLIDFLHRIAGTRVHIPEDNSTWLWWVLLVRCDHLPSRGSGAWQGRGAEVVVKRADTSESEALAAAPRPGA